MTFRFIYTLCFLICGMSLAAQTDSTRFGDNYKSVLSMHNPLLETNNPSAIFFNPKVEVGKAVLNYSRENGGFKPSMKEDELGRFFFDTEKYYWLGNTIVYGAFSYANRVEKEVDYSHLDDPYSGTPYLYVDTIGGDKCNREIFKIDGSIATSVNNNLTLGASIDYRVGNVVQNRDPRSRNKVANFSLKPGLTLDLGSIQLGGDVYYRYDNEEIDVKTVEANAFHTLYMLTGLGTFSSHEAATFSRLYEKNTWGGDVQIKFGNHVISGGSEMFSQTADDGRKGGYAIWSTEKNDSKFRGARYSLNHLYTHKKGLVYQRLKLGATYQDMLGTEILQKLMQHSDIDLYEWKTFKEEDKYSKDIFKASINYTRAKYREEYLEDYSWNVAVEYKEETEKYYLPDAKINFSNLLCRTSLSKLLQFKKSELTSKMEVAYNKNLKKRADLSVSNSITEKIILPDYVFFSSDYFHFGFGMMYSRYMENLKHRIFLKGDYKMILSHSNKHELLNSSRGYWGLSAGILF